MEIDATAIQAARTELANLQELIRNPSETDSPEKVAILRLRLHKQYQMLAALRQKSSDLHAQCHGLAQDYQLMTQFEAEVRLAAQKEKGAELQFDSSWLPVLDNEPMDIEPDGNICSEEGKHAWRRIELEEEQRQQLFLKRMELTSARERLIVQKEALKKKMEADTRVLSAAKRARDSIAHLEKQLTQTLPQN